MLKRLLFVLAAVFIIAFAQAQSQNQKFYHLTRNNGLSQSTVNCIIKDAEGFMWFGTSDGLNRYDGYSFIHYQYNAADPYSLGLGRVNVLFTDRQKRLWVGTDQGGLNLYDPLKDNFRRFPEEPGQGKYPVHDVRDIVQAESGQLFVATQGTGLLLFDPESGEFNSFTFSNLPNINCLVFSRQGDLYVGTPEGVYIVRKAFQAANPGLPLFKIKSFAGIQVLDLYIDDEGILWVGTYGNGAFAYDPGSNQMQEFSTRSKHPGRLKHDIVRAFINDAEGNLLIGTGGGGIQSLNREKNRMTSFEHKLNDEYSLNSNIIYSFYLDDTRNLWIGTYNGGVNVLYKFRDKFNQIRSFGEENNLSDNSVLSIIEGNDGRIWIGTDGGGLDAFDPFTGNYTHYRNNPSSSNSISGNVVKTLFFDSRGLLWIGTFNNGLNVFNPATKKFTRYPNQPGGVSSDHIWDIVEDAQGNIWLATLGEGLDKFDYRNRKFTNYRNHPDNSNSLSDNTLSCLLYDSKGDLWIGTEYGGVCKLVDPNAGIFKVYSREMEDRISSNQIATIYEDSRHNIWVGTVGGGLNLFIPEEDRFKNYTVADGLANNLVYAILEDKNGDLWISTNNGMSQFKNGINRPDTCEFRNFNEGDGLQSNEFAAGSACITDDGVLYFGGINGINYFTPDEIQTNTNIPLVVITDFKIFNQSVTAGSPNSPLEAPVSQTRHITLDHTKSVISFQFAALDFTMPSQNSYRFILEGFEEKWNEVGSQRTATYTNLNPGTYVFKVQGSNNDDVWNRTGAAIGLTILAPFWKTVWFRFAMVLAGIVFVLGIYWWRVKALEMNRITLKKLVSERTSELLQANSLLSKQNLEIELQRKELMAQKENLLQTNTELAKNQERIKEQNLELENHRNNLQDLVYQRTTELENAKLQAEASDKLKSAFLANMSHEIRTPLNAIVGFSALLNDADLEQDEREEFMQHIQSNTTHLLVLIDDILDLSKIESNQLRLSIVPVRLNGFIEEISRNFMKRKESLEFRQNNTIAAQDVTFASDRTRLSQILNNLLDNAFKFTDKGYIELGAKGDGKNLIFYVEDTGIGMSEEVLEKIYDRFFKSELGGSRLYRGTGLGLTITKKLVTLLGGSIIVTSNPGAGSRFEIIFPM